MIIGVPDYLLLPVRDAIVLPGEFKADALKDELACSYSFTSSSILILQGFRYQSVIFLDSCYYITLFKESEHLNVSSLAQKQKQNSITNSTDFHDFSTFALIH